MLFNVVTVVAPRARVFYREAVPDRIDWVLLVYRLPRQPSTPRIALWRKLRRLGVAQLLDGLVALPADARTVEQLEWLADEVVEAGGQAAVWQGRPGSPDDERGLVSRMAATVGAEYQRVIDEADAAAMGTAAARRRAVERLRRQMARIERRDFFPPANRELARRAVRELAQVMEDAR